MKIITKKVTWHTIEISIVFSTARSMEDETVGTIDLGTNPSEPTSECGLEPRSTKNQTNQVNKRYHVFYSPPLFRTAGSGGAL